MKLTIIYSSLVKKIILLMRTENNNNKSQLIREENNKSIPWTELRELKKNPYVKIGKYTYGLTKNTVIRATYEASVTVGKFCSFAPNVTIFAHADHPLNFPSTYPFKTLFSNVRKEVCDPTWPNYDAITYGPINIGNDVWIGQNVTILSGVTIGNGVVIGVGSVVSKDVPPYAIVVGNPARIIRYRFSSELIKSFEEIKWWNFPDEEIESLLPYFYSNPEAFVDELKRRNYLT